MNNTEPGLLLVGHGTRNAVGTRQFLDLAQVVAGRLRQACVQPAFLELQEPTIEQGIERLAAAGVERVVVVPLLLFAAGHAKRDIPAATAAALARHGMTAVQTEPFGCEEALLELSHKRFAEAASVDSTSFNPEPEAKAAPRIPCASGCGLNEDCLLLVGRGSRDEVAIGQMQEFARLRQQRELGMRMEVAFLAMALPSLAEVLPRIAAEGFRRVVVQPHLLFQGELASSLEREIEKMAARDSRTEWLLTPLLADAAGTEGLGTAALANVICERFVTSQQCSGATIRVVAPAGEH